MSITNPDGSVENFQYSPLGFMVGSSTTTGASTSQTNYLVDPTGLGNVVAAYSGSGSLIADYTYGLGLVMQTGPGGTGYYDFDASGNTIGITGPSGTYVNQYSYLPFGETTTISAALPNPFTFAGQDGVIEIGTDLFDMRARIYDVLTGQFLSNDPLGLAGGDSNVAAMLEMTRLTLSIRREQRKTTIRRQVRPRMSLSLPHRRLDMSRPAALSSYYRRILTRRPSRFSSYLAFQRRIGMPQELLALEAKFRKRQHYWHQTKHGPQRPRWPGRLRHQAVCDHRSGIGVHGRI